MRRLARNPKFWLAAFLVWLGVLWCLSSFTLKGPDMPPVEHIDKLEHFAYFFGGSAALSAFLFTRNPQRPNWKAILGGAILTIAVIGGIDEYHQSFTPGRSGNDPYDLLADVLGATAGAFALKRMHRRLE